jgi:hypothetical protein
MGFINEAELNRRARRVLIPADCILLKVGVFLTRKNFDFMAQLDEALAESLRVDLRACIVASWISMNDF